MKKHINFGDIGQFKDVVKGVTHAARYVGKDEAGNAVYDHSKRLPIIAVIATEKIHGTNAAVCYDENNGMWVQSRENIITPEKDNGGCAFFVETNADGFINIIEYLKTRYNIDLFRNTISIYFEFAGGNIQKNSALSGLEKHAIIFPHFKVTPHDEEHSSYWLYVHKDFDFILPNLIKFIGDFPTYTFEIDFETPSLAVNKMLEVVAEIEANSPVGKELGKEGNIGEGIVCTFWFKDQLYRFKVKGDKHANSKVKTLKPVDDAKENAKIEFANYATPAWRLEQMAQKVAGIGSELNHSQIPDFLRAVMADVVKEESGVMAEKGLEPKDVGGMISKIARNWFLEQVNKV